MKKALVIIAAILVMVAITGCSNATTSTSTTPTTTVTTTTPATSTTTTNSDTDTPVANSTSEAYAPENPADDSEEEDTNQESSTRFASDEENNLFEEYKSYFLQQKALQEDSMRAMVARGQYESFEARDFSKYGIWEYEAWHWTDSYGCEYQWPVLVDEDEKEEMLFIESDDGHLIQFTYWGQMLRKMDLGSLYD